MNKKIQQKPTNAFIGASWLALGIGVISFMIGIWNSTLLLNEKGFYFTVLLFGLFSAVSLQKTVRDKLEELPVNELYYGICWFSLITSIVLLSVGLWNASLALSVKGFYAISFFLSLFATVTIQKNIRDLALYSSDSEKDRSEIESNLSSL